MVKKLVEAELETQLEAIPDWRVVDGRLERKLMFEDFMEAVNFVNEIAAVAEELDHHPDVHIHWNALTIHAYTHSADAVTDRDTRLAREIDRLVAEWWE